MMLGLPLSLLLLSGLIQSNPFARLATTTTQASQISAANNNDAVVSTESGNAGETISGFANAADRPTELSEDLLQALQNTNGMNTPDHSSVIPVTLHLPVQRMDFNTTPYRFQTSVAGPDEPVVYSLNGQQISIEEFYAFQQSLLQDQADREAHAQANRQELNARVAAALLPAFKDATEHDEIRRQLRINGGSIQTNLAKADILRIADELAGSGIRLSLLHTNYSGGYNSADNASVDGASWGDASWGDAETNLRNPLGAGLLIGFILCAYGLTFRSLSGMRMSA